MSFKSRLKEFIQSQNLRVLAFEKSINASNGYVNSLTKGISTKKYIIINQKYPNLNMDWLLTGVGTMLVSDKPSTTPEITESTTMQIPLVNQYAQAGYLNGFGDQEWVGDLPKIPWILEDNPENFLSFEVRGDSMDDASSESLIEGDLMLCKNLPQDYWSTKLLIHKWDFVIVHKEQGVLVKRISEHNTKTGDLTLHSLNTYYEDVIINIKDVAKLFTIKDYRRSMRR